MATLNIGLSEYDMMRESKKNLENQVEDFKKIVDITFLVMEYN